ncbi:aryl-sulfate sulfotransferase [Chloroflexota bacterium]
MKRITSLLLMGCLLATPLFLISCVQGVTDGERAEPPVEERVTRTEEVGEVVGEEITREDTEQPPATTPRDTAAPAAITGLVAADAYDGRVNLGWDKSADEGFDHYNVYIARAEIKDIAGMTPAHRVNGITENIYQVTGLEEGTRYYFAVTAVDRSGNEPARVMSVSAVTTPMPRGDADSGLQLDVYKTDRAWAGTTLFSDISDSTKPRIIEVNMLGEVIWEYLVPRNLVQYTGGGFDTEWLPNDNILFVLPRKGVYEVNRRGEVVWSYLTGKISHDADRLPNGNTIFVWGFPDKMEDAQVVEVNPKGDTVWTWYARDHFSGPRYAGIYDDGFTHTNAVTRLPDGNTLISTRNFNFVVEVDRKGAVVRTIGEGHIYNQHDPEVLANGNVLCSSFRPHKVVEIDPGTNRVVWEFLTFPQNQIPNVRDNDRLPNGNTLLCGSAKIAEVTAGGEIVWQVSRKGLSREEQGTAKGFFKAERVGIRR